MCQFLLPVCQLPPAREIHTKEGHDGVHYLEGDKKVVVVFPEHCQCIHFVKAQVLLIISVFAWVLSKVYKERRYTHDDSNNGENNKTLAIHTYMYQKNGAI